MKQIASIVAGLAALLFAGCTSVSRENPTGPVCKVHGVPLQAGVAPIVYGLLGFDGDYLAAKEKLYPNSASFVIGGCSVRPEKAAAVAYCPKCRVLDPVARQEVDSDGMLSRSGSAPLVEVEVQFIAFAREDISLLSRHGSIEADALLKLHREGKAALVCAPKIVTQFGVEATVKSVEEFIYPTDFSVAVVTNLPGQPDQRTVAVVPDGFETREVGVILSVMPEATPNPEVIQLTLTPEAVAEPTWRKYVAQYTDPSGKEHTAELDTPFFYTQSLWSHITVHLGEPTICGGGMTSRDKQTVTYAFVIARLLPSKPHSQKDGETVDPSTGHVRK